MLIIHREKLAYTVRMTDKLTKFKMWQNACSLFWFVIKYLVDWSGVLSIFTCVKQFESWSYCWYFINLRFSNNVFVRQLRFNLYWQVCWKPLPACCYVCYVFIKCSLLCVIVSFNQPCLVMSPVDGMRGVIFLIFCRIGHLG